MKALLPIGLLLALTVPALAQDHFGHAAAPTDNPAAATYQAANAAMHQDMMIQYTGDADIDFLQGMIAHHKGAIAMAEIVLQYGADPAIKTLAQDIMKAQDAEIALMEKWLAERVG